MNDFLRADSLASACAYKSSFTREWELTGLTGILQQIIFSQLVSKSKSVWGFSHRSCRGTARFVAVTGSPATAPMPLASPSRSYMDQLSRLPRSLQSPGALTLLFERRDVAAPSSGGIRVAADGPLRWGHPPQSAAIPRSFLWMLALCLEILPQWTRASASNSNSAFYSLPGLMEISQLSSGFLIRKMRCHTE